MAARPRRRPGKTGLKTSNCGKGKGERFFKEARKMIATEDREDRWLSPKEAAAVMGLSERKFKEIRSQLPQSRLGHRTVRFSMIGVQDYMRAERPPPKRSRGTS